MFSGYFQEALLFKNVVRNIFFVDRHFEAFPRHEEFCNNIVLPVLFDNERSGRKVRRSGKVNSCHAIAPTEVFKGEVLSCCPFYVHIVKPCDRRILFDITDGKYEKVVIGQDMKVRVYADEREIQLESVSRGTIEQIYLSIRVAAAKLLWQDEPMPFLFDDVFAYYDDERLAAAINMLKKCGHQVIIFSCHSREDSLLR